MYVNTLITLQENFSTYGLDGNKVTGHVILNSPGLIKCYVQNLKQSISGQTYALYVFSKDKDKGVRVGALSSNKETKWMVEAKDIGGSGITLEEVDGVAIVSEDNQRGADTILMGFKNNRYMIIPLIDQITRKRLSPKPQMSGGMGSSENYPKKPMKPESPENLPPQPSKAECPENSPPKPPKPDGLGNPVPRPPVMGCLGNPIPKLPQQPVPEGPGNPPPRPPVPEGTGNLPSQQGYPENSLPSIPVPESLKNPLTEEVNVHIVEADEIPSDSGPSVLHQKDSAKEEHVPNETSPELQEPGPVIPNSSMPGYQEETGRTDGINISVLKIAQMLKEIEKKANVEPVVKANDEENRDREEREATERLNQDIQQNLEEKTRIHNKVTQELRRIINILRDNQEGRQENRGIKEQIEKIRELPQSHKLIEKPNIEKTIESRYMKQKIDESNDRESIEEIVNDDTTPKKALNFILKQQDEIEFVTKKITESREEAHKEEAEQPETDYISEIDKKIEEIKTKRKQEKY